MKAAQINKYSKEIKAEIVDVPVPTITNHEVLVKVKVAAVNPLDILNITGSVKLVQDYKMPLILGNELTGIVEKVGESVTKFKTGDAIYTRLPLDKIGAFAEYVAVDASAISHLPKNLDFVTGAAVPLTGLTAYQALHEELHAKAGQTLFIAGGSGSFGQMAVPLAKEMGLNVIVSGNAEAHERIIAAGATQYFDYRKENYWEILKDVDFVIDTLGPTEFERELSVIRPGGRLLSLRAVPNKRFTKNHNLPFWKRKLFSIVGAKYDRLAMKHGVNYHFMFVRADGTQLKEITKIIEDNNLVPTIEPREFTLEQVNDALSLVASGHPKGKVVIKL